jgi:butyryl-CoA dehydrogenase/short/branched chain acyl-CoA dehydrogenase
MQPLTRLSDEEELFQTTVGQFARERVAPHVRQMDESGVFRKELLDELFELGLSPKNMADKAEASSNPFSPSKSWQKWIPRRR